MERLVLVRRYEFAPLEGGIPYLRQADMYSDGEALYAFFVFHNPGRKKYRKALARITVYDEEKKPKQVFGVKLDFSDVLPGRTYFYPEPVVLPIQSDGFNFEFLRFDHARAPVAVDAPEEETKEPSTEENAEVQNTAEKPAETIEKPQNPVKTFVIHKRSMPKTFFFAGIPVIAAAVVVAMGFSRVPYIPPAYDPNWYPGQERWEGELGYRLYSDDTVSVIGSHRRSSYVYVPSEFNGRSVRKIEPNALDGYEDVDAPSVDYVAPNAFGMGDFLRSLRVGSNYGEDHKVEVFGSAMPSSRLRELQIGGAGYFYDDGVYIPNEPGLQVTFHNKAEYFRGSIFQGDYSFEGLISRSGNISFEDSPLSYAEIRLETSTLPNRLFAGCYNLYNVSVDYNGGRDYSIGENAFESSAIEKYDFDRVSYIGARAFSHCENLYEVWIPDSCSSIGTGAFEYCTNLNTVNLTSSTQFNRSDFPTWTKVYRDDVLVEPEESGVQELQYEYDEEWGGYSVTGYSGSGWGSVWIPEVYEDIKVVSIGNNAFKNIAATSIEGGRNIRYIGSYAFSNSSIQNVNMESEHVTLAQNSLTGAASLSDFYVSGDIEFQNNVTTQNREINISCSGMMRTEMTPFTSNSPRVNLSMGCFDQGEVLANLLGRSVRTINIQNYLVNDVPACASAQNLEEVNIHFVSPTHIEDGAFQNSVRLNYFDFNNVETIGESAFRGTGFVNIDFPDSVKTIGAYAFADCSKLDVVTLSHSTSFESNSFPSTTEIRYR